MHVSKGAAASSSRLPTHYPGLVLGAGVKLSLHLKCRVISQLLPEVQRFVHWFLKLKSTFKDKIMAAEVQVLEAAGEARYLVVQGNRKRSNANFLGCVSSELANSFSSVLKYRGSWSESLK